MDVLISSSSSSSQSIRSSIRIAWDGALGSELAQIGASDVPGLSEVSVQRRVTKIATQKHTNVSQTSICVTYMYSSVCI